MGTEAGALPDYAMGTEAGAPPGSRGFMQWASRPEALLFPQGGVRGMLRGRSP